MRIAWLGPAGLLVFLIGAGSGCRDADKGKPSDDTKHNPTQAIRARYLKSPPDALKIVEPIAELEAYYFKDGGTKGLRLKDANGTEHLFCLGGRSIFEPEMVKDRDSSKNPKE